MGKLLGQIVRDFEIREFIYEIRYSPNPKFLDFRGDIAQELVQRFDMPHWRIGENLAEAYNGENNPDDGSEKYFLSFRNAGLVMRGVDDRSIFYERTKDHINFLFSLRKIFKDNDYYITRIGMMSKYVTAYSGDFSALLDKYQTYFITPKQSFIDCFDANLTDISGVINLETRDGVKIHSRSGPMEKAQIKTFFPNQEVEFDLGLYFEIDAFIEPNQVVKQSFVASAIHDLFRINWGSHSKFLEAILREK